MQPTRLLSPGSSACRHWLLGVTLALVTVVSSAGLAQAASGSGRSGVTAAQVNSWARHYRANHPGKARDINAKTRSQLASDPAARRLISICGKHQRPVIPILAWEYGGNDHPWIRPGAAALAYCVYTPVKRNTSHWRYSRAKDHVTADVYVRFPDQNPCRNKRGKNQVLDCLGDSSNIEILVDTASLNDGSGAGLNLSEASTTLRLILPSGKTVQLVSES
jgi:hypothetical protein